MERERDPYRGAVTFSLHPPSDPARLDRAGRTEMSLPSTRTAKPVLTKRRIGIAGIAAILGCALCCAIPLLAAAGIGGGLATTLSSLLHPGFELIAGVAVFVVVLAGMLVFGRKARATESGCGPSCAADRSCCGPAAENR